MLRQRLRSHTSLLAPVGRLLTFVLACALVWYGLMTVLLAVKVAPTTVNAISGYRTAFDWLAGLQPADVAGGATRAILAAAGVIVFLVLGYVAFKLLPRPYLARQPLELAADEHGMVHMAPRAIERLAETAARYGGGVHTARGRYGTDDLTVDVTVERARDVARALQDVQRRVVAALERHGLPEMPVNVILAGFDRRRRRELQ